MRVNTRVFTERIDMMGHIQIPTCPSQIRTVSENIVNMLTKPDFAIGDYHTMTELDKLLMWHYWREYDELYIDRIEVLSNLANWFVYKATPPDLITRARRWLCEHNYTFVKADVAERAHEAQDKFAKQITASRQA